MVKHCITHQGVQIPYTVRRSARGRRLRLSVHPNAQVFVSVPKRISLDTAHAWVKEKAPWIWQVSQRLEKQSAKFNTTGVHQPTFAASKNRAKKRIVERVKFWNEQYNFLYNKITIKDSGSRWGSCSKEKNLNFNYRLLFLSEELLDYVVVHELCHLKELNHSRAFWGLVGKALPDYRARRRELGRYSSGEKL